MTTYTNLHEILGGDVTSATMEEIESMVSEWEYEGWEFYTIKRHLGVWAYAYTDEENPANPAILGSGWARLSPDLYRLKLGVEVKTPAPTTPEEPTITYKSGETPQLGDFVFHHLQQLTVLRVNDFDESGIGLEDIPYFDDPRLFIKLNTEKAAEIVHILLVKMDDLDEQERAARQWGKPIEDICFQKGLVWEQLRAAKKALKYLQSDAE